MSLFSSGVTDTDKRKALRAGLRSGELQRWPGAFSPLVAKLVADIGFEGVYVSGAVLSADLGLPDIGLTTLTEVATRAGAIARATDLPALVDGDTGFGEPMSAARTVAMLEDAGLAGCHLEDQVNPKRCGHLDGKDVVPVGDMLKRLAAAVNGRRDENFVICARTDARAIEGLDAAIDRLPTIVAADMRRSRGLDPVAPHHGLGYAENFLNMCFGEVPDPAIVRAFAKSMVLYAEHSFNASTFAARVVTSTQSDIYSAVTAAIGALKGSLHGGANEAVMYDMIEIDRPELARAWLDAKLERKEKIMGFGHRVYKNGDSRVPTMKAAFAEVAAHVGDSRWLGIYTELEAAMAQRTGIKPNLDFPTGPAYHLMGFDIASFTPIFVMSRITGWTAHIMEQVATNALIRPLSQYSGVPQRVLGG